MISKAEKKAEDYRLQNQVTWKGKQVLNWIAREPYAKMLVNIDLLQAKKLKAIEKLESKNEALTLEAKNSHASTLSSFKQKNKSKGANLGYITLVLQLVMFVCVIFCEYYDYRVDLDFEGKTMELEKQKIIEDFLSTQKAQEKAQSIEGFLDEGYPKKSPKNLPKVIQQQALGVITQSPKLMPKKPKTRSFSKDLKLSLSRISGNISTYKNAVERYKLEGKYDLIASNLDKLHYWESVKKNKAIQQLGLRVV